MRRVQTVGDLAVRRPLRQAPRSDPPRRSCPRIAIGAPYLTLHRADLQAALHAACSEAKKVTLKPRFEVGGITQTGASVRATSTDGGVAEGPALIAADGVWSEVRKTRRAECAPHLRRRYRMAHARPARRPRSSVRRAGRRRMARAQRSSRPLPGARRQRPQRRRHH